MFYTNRSTITKTFHGVTFRPGETKEVSGIINDPKMVVSSTRQEPPKRVRRDKTKGITDTQSSTTVDTEVAVVLDEASADSLETQGN